MCSEALQQTEETRKSNADLRAAINAKLTDAEADRRMEEVKAERIDRDARQAAREAAQK